MGYAGSVERLVALTDEHANFSREFASCFPLRGLVYSGEASGQPLFDGVVRRFESAQSQFGCQIVHRYFTGSILARKPVPALEECINIPFGAMFALLICHSAHLVQVRPHRTVVAVLWQLEQRAEDPREAG